MRTIKFRGRRFDNGETVYGDLTHDGGHIYIDDKRVKPESVAQFWDYDVNGDELYDDDEVVLTLADGREVVGKLTAKVGVVSEILRVVYGFTDLTEDDEFMRLEELARYKPRKLMWKD